MIMATPWLPSSHCIQWPVTKPGADASERLREIRALVCD